MAGEKMDHNMGKVENLSSTLSLKKDQLLIVETREFCPVNLFTNEWLHKLEGSVRNTAVDYSWVYGTYVTLPRRR